MESMRDCWIDYICISVFLLVTALTNHSKMPVGLIADNADRTMPSWADVGCEREHFHGRYASPVKMLFFFASYPNYTKKERDIKSPRPN